MENNLGRLTKFDVFPLPEYSKNGDQWLDWLDQDEGEEFVSSVTRDNDAVVRYRYYICIYIQISLM